MLAQVLLTLTITLNTIQTVMEREKALFDVNKFYVNPDDLTSDHCTIQDSLRRAEHYFLETCPTTYDPVCNDPIFNKNHEFEFRCRFPMRTNRVLSMNSTSFLDLMKMRDPYARDWCMIVLFHSPSCPFSARLAPHFNQIPGKFENILPVAVDASDFSKSHRLNFRYGVSGTPTVLLWVNGQGVGRMGNKDLDLENIKKLITTHTDLIEVKEKVEKENIIPEKFIEFGAELKDLSGEMIENQLSNILTFLFSVFVCATTFIYHVRERILLSAPVLQWFQSRCGGPLCEDIYFLFYVVAPRNRAPRPATTAPAAAAPAAPEEVPEAAPEVAQNDDELAPLVIED
ncbi:hypothetical protein GCK72_013358 [Caenorhabditis remanei]|uniref:Thioredoxin domain-containing protein n=1 Tax=Caenorhabditis remanei TaxID=31234 RepID=A0A6A5GQJ8_CAERE|nr:hypothetical protein GCK72_013358 [Caenorhabditis remanei]KAF1756904.1 hypothetical protein GCK72_013358 [Caenorhabditis remanei]